MDDFELLLEESLKDPEFKKEWEENQTEYDIMRMLVMARAEKNLTQKELIYHIGNCPVCSSYGRMEILFDTSLCRCFAMCEECLLEFASVSDYRKNNGNRIFYKSNDTVPYIRPATLDEINGTEWFPYLTDEYCFD